VIGLAYIILTLLCLRLMFKRNPILIVSIGYAYLFSFGQNYLVDLTGLTEYSFNKGIVPDGMMLDSLQYASLCSIVLALIVSVKKNLINSVSDVSYNSRQKDAVFWFASICVFVSIVLFALTGTGMHGTESSNGYIIRLLDADISIMVFVVLLFFNTNKIKRRDKWLVLFYVAYSVGRGSRSSVLFISLLWIGSKIKTGDFSALKLSRILRKYYLVLFLGIFVYIGGNYFRITNSYGYISLNMLMETINLQMIVNISNRFGDLDILSAILNSHFVNDYNNDEIFDRILILKETVNSFLPGSLFANNYESAEKVFPYHFRGFDKDMLHAEHWTLFGASYAKTKSKILGLGVSVLSIVQLIAFYMIARRFIFDRTLQAVWDVIFSMVILSGFISTGSPVATYSVILRYLLVLTPLSLIKGRVRE